MHKLITAALLATTIASPLMAQDYPGNRGPGNDPYGRQARDHDRGRDARPDFQRGNDQARRPDDRGPGRGPPPGGWQNGRGAHGWDQRGWDGRGWDQRWRSDQRYDWRGYRASHRDVFRVPGYYAPGGYGYRRFQPGYRIDALFYDQRYWIADPYAYRLPPAYGPYRWVRYFDDVLLIDLRSGLVVESIPGFFY